MKIEKISDLQIRCTLDHTDLASREIKLSELAYGTEKAKLLFHDMIEQASFQFGFKADDMPLMIEAIPVSPDCLVLILTKVEDPEELDTRFSQFMPDDYENECEEYDNFDEFDDIGSFQDNIREVPGSNDSCFISSGSSSQSDGFMSMKDTINARNNADIRSVRKENNIYIFFSFADWNEASEAASRVVSVFTGTSHLFRCNNDRLLLAVTCDNMDRGVFSKVCNTLSEYGTKEKSNYATSSYFFEHSKVLVKGNAIKILSEY